MRILTVSVSLFLCAGFAAGCGGSRHLAASSEHAAIAAAQSQNDNLRIFPTRPGTKACKIPPSHLSTRLISGQCTTKVASHGHGTQVDFVQRANVNGQNETGDWTYYLDGHNRFIHFHPSGWLPQDEP